MKHTAQDVLDAAIDKFPHYFDIDDAKKVLDASPNEIKIRKCYFKWDDENKNLTFHCIDELTLTLEHPMKKQMLGKRLKDLKKSLNEQKEEPKTKVPKRKI